MTIIFRPLFAAGGVVALVLGLFALIVPMIIWDEIYPEMPDPHKVWMDCEYMQADEDSSTDLQEWREADAIPCDEATEHDYPIATGELQTSAAVFVDVCTGRRFNADVTCRWGWEFEVSDYFPQCHYHGWQERWTVERDGEIIDVYEPEGCDHYGSDKEWYGNTIGQRYRFSQPGGYVIRWQFFDRGGNERYAAQTEITFVAP